MKLNLKQTRTVRRYLKRIKKTNCRIHTNRVTEISVEPIGKGAYFAALVKDESGYFSTHACFFVGPRGGLTIHSENVW